MVFAVIVPGDPTPPAPRGSPPFGFEQCLSPGGDASRAPLGNPHLDLGNPSVALGNLNMNFEKSGFGF